MNDLVLNEQIKIEKFLDKEGYYYIELEDLNNQVIITQLVFDLLKIIENFPRLDIAELCDKFNEVEGMNISEGDVSESINLLLKNGIILSPDKKAQKRKNKYLKLKLPLLPSAIVNVLSQFFIFLFQKPVILFFLATIPFVLFEIFSKGFNVEVEKQLPYTTYIIIIFLSIIFHELGHSTALAKYKLKSGEIGVGLYLFVLPVFYTNLSQAWKLKAKQRLVVDFGGIYLQYIYMLVILIFCYFFPALKFLPVTIFFLILYQLNPFLRLDGYWIISDLIKETNLMQVSTKALTDYLVGLISKNPMKLDKKNIVMIIYSIIHKTYVLFIYASILLMYPKLFIEFPKNVSTLLATKPFFSSTILSTVVLVSLPIGVLLGVVFLVISNIKFIKKIYHLASSYE